MSKELLISSTSLETRLAILEDDQVTEIFIERAKSRGILGNIYKGKVTRVLPGMQAAFVDVGLDRDAFLYVSDFFEAYEEYEEMFGASAETVELYEPERGEAGKKKRRRNRRGSRRRKEAGGKARTAPAPDATPKQAGSVLPDQLESAEQVPDRAPEALPLGGDILPGLLEPMAEFDSSESESGGLADAEAEIKDRSGVQELAVTRERRRRRRDNEPRNGGAQIGDLLSEGQEVLVQVAKEPIGKKGARITSHVALPGRFLVYMPTVEHVGVSRKIVSEDERQRLKECILKLRGDSRHGFIVRTVGEGKKEEDFRKDMEYLTAVWEDIRGKAEKMSAPSLVHSEPGLVRRVVRDYFSGDFKVLRLDDEHEYERVVEFVNRFNPRLVNRVRLYNRNTPLFDHYGVTTELEKALKQKVWLKNGGYIVINQTEALVAIDVNTGKFVGSTNSLEDTITRTNLDAVREVVRQIRLRDLGGIIVIDFIDMDERKNREKVMDALQKELARDKSPSKILQFNEFGLVAITRKRVKQSLERMLCQPCSYCSGTGLTRSARTTCYAIHQEVRRMLEHFAEGEEILIRCHPDVAKSLQNGERKVVSEIEEMTGKAVSVKADPLMHVEQFDLIEI